MLFRRGALALSLLASTCYGATLGTAVPVVGGAADLVLDEARNRLYLVNTNRNQLEVYSIPQRRFLDPVPVEALPLSAAISRSGKYLYVTSNTGGALLVIDLDTLSVVNRISLPARPEGVAVGADERVLISTVGAGPNNSLDVLLIYDPSASGSSAVSAVAVAPAAPQDPRLPAIAGRPFLINRSQLRASHDGRFIVGVNLPNNNSRAVFVYETASGTVLRSRTVTGASSVISIAPDGSKFMAGLTLFDSATLTVLAQQNAANAPYPFQPGTNFNTQQNQGGSVFAPDGSLLYSAFNFAPVQNPPARANVSQLMLNDPDNLLIEMGLQLPENLAGKMVISSDGRMIFALSESGFMILPVGTLSQNPVAEVENPTVLLANDQCGLTADQRQASVLVRNEGRGRLTATAQLLQLAPTGPSGLGGTGGAGGGAPGGAVVIVIQPAPPGQSGDVPAAPTLPGGRLTPQNAAIAQTAPAVRSQPSPEGAVLQFSYNPNAARSLGTVSPTHTFLVQSDQAVNIPAMVRVFQNNHDSETRSEVMPVTLAPTANEGLVDMALDSARQRLYITNSGMNRVEVFDTSARRFLAPIKVGQLPRTMALAPDGNTLYVANTGGESISIINLDTGEVAGRVKFPPVPFNANVPLVSPSLIASGLRGPLVVMNNGTIWRIVGDEAVPRALSSVIGSLTVPAPRTMAATPNGEFILLLAGNGYAYLYDALADDFVQGRQVVTAPIRGYYGPVAAGPGGQYYLVNGLVLNQSLTPTISDTISQPTRPGQTPTATPAPVSAVAAVGTTTFARFTQPTRANQNAVVSQPPVVELVDVNRGNIMRSAPAAEGPLSAVVGNQRANVDGRTMAVDAFANTAYILTTSGLSIVDLDTPTAVERPSVNRGGVVNLADYTPRFAPGGLISIFGRNLGDSLLSDSSSLPTILGGTCVTLNNRSLPLFMTSAEQINAQIPPDLAAGRYNLVIRSVQARAASQSQNITIARYAPAVFVDPVTGQAAIFREDGSPVTPSTPARRDRLLVLYATGLGATKGGAVTAGEPAPSDPLAVTDKVQVFFGDPRIKEAEVIVDWSGLLPGSAGVYQVNLRVPGARLKGDNLPVTLRIGGVDSPTDGPLVPVVTVD